MIILIKKLKKFTTWKQIRKRKSLILSNKFKIVFENVDNQNFLVC